MSTQ
jgi:uncharacterized protein DUF255